MESSRVRLAADVGGTFTDVAAFDETTGELRLGKTLTTPARLVTGVESGVTKAGAQFSAVRLFLHGTTVAINTILERTGAPCALLTTQGFRDIYEIGRVNRPESYNLFFRRHQPLIERDLRYEIRERMDAHGKVLIELDEDQVRAAVADAGRQGVEAIAILFLHSYRNPAHEQRVKKIIEESHPHLFVTASHELSQEYREFERTSTAAANAYIGPRVRRYLGEIGDHLAAAGFDGDFLIVQSTGGLFGVEEAQSACIRMLESGPAAGVIGTKALCDRIGLKNAIAFDMGGTTAKAGVIHGGDVLMTGGALIGGYATGLPVQIPMIDIQEVGTGGGSIARTEMGALHVGPESAGAQPGPVCYGLGGVEPTITDANLILGRLNADRFLGGEIKLDVEGARRALEARVATPLALDLTAAADGILRIATTKMSHMVRWVTTERGLDAADFTLVAYGGAGAAHRQGRPARPRPFFRLWHAGRGAAPRFRQDLVHAARRGLVSGDGEHLRRDGAARPRGRAPRRHRRRRRRGRALGGHALCRAGARGHRRASARAIPGRGSRRYQDALRCRARDPLRLFGPRREGRDRQPARRDHGSPAQADIRAYCRGPAGTPGSRLSRRPRGLFR